jgi:hypothetical protein
VYHSLFNYSIDLLLVDKAHYYGLFWIPLLS